MSLEDLNAKLRKIADEPVKPDHRVARACVREPKVDAILVKSPLLKSLVDAITADDVELVLQTWREAMIATRSFWRETGRDPKTNKSIGAWVSEPDHRVRIEASKLIAAYKEGLPMQRQLQLTGDFKDLREMLEQARQSPEMMRALHSLDSLPSVAEGSDSRPIPPGPPQVTQD